MRIIAVILLIIIWSIIVPYLLGQLMCMLIKDGRYSGDALSPDSRGTAVSRNIAYGFMVMCVSFLILTTPMIVMHLAFHCLLYSWSALIALLCVVSVIMDMRWDRLGSRAHRDNGKSGEESAATEDGRGQTGNGLRCATEDIKQFIRMIMTDRFTSCIWIAAVAVIIFEAALPAFTMHVDADDARFIEEANEATEYDTMLVRHAITNKYIGFAAGEQIKEVTAPYPLLIAVLSRLYGVNAPAITAHTILPPLLIFLCYLVYGLIGAYIFKGDIKKRGLFLLFLSLIHLFSFETEYASGYTLLTIIWQGRSVSAMIMLPLMWYLLMRTTDKGRLTACDYLTVTAAGLANAMLSNMGAILAVVMLSAYAVVNGVRLRSFKTLVLMGVCAVPEAALVGFTRFLRGVMERMPVS